MLDSNENCYFLFEYSNLSYTYILYEIKWRLFDSKSELFMWFWNWAFFRRFHCKNFIAIWKWLDSQKISYYSQILKLILYIKENYNLCMTYTIVHVPFSKNSNSIYLCYFLCFKWFSLFFGAKNCEVFGLKIHCQ